MAKKFQIQPNPTFKADVAIPRVGGEPINVPFEFRYRDREQLAELYAGWSERYDALRERMKGGELALPEQTAAQMDIQVEQIQALVVGWAFDDKLTEASIRDLVKTSAGAPEAVIAAYSAAFAPARLGN